MEKKKILKYLFLAIAPILAFLGIFVVIVTTLPAVPSWVGLIVALLFFTLLFLSVLFSILLLQKLFFYLRREKLFYRIFIASTILSFLVVVFFLNSFVSVLLGVIMPIAVVSLLLWTYAVFFKSQNQKILLRFWTFFRGVVIAVFLFSVAVGLTATFLTQNAKKFGYAGWAYDIVSIPESVRDWYYFKTSTLRPQKDFLEHNTAKDDYFYLGESSLIVNKNTQISTPNFSKGRISFIKDGGLWIAESNGRSFQVTPDVGKNEKSLFSYTLYYEHPFWSPEGDKLVFVQNIQLSNGVKLSRWLATDGKTVAGTSSRHNPSLPAYWLDNNHVLLARIDDFSEEGIEIKEDGIKFSYDPRPGPLPWFENGYSMPDGCGGGGRPDWSYRLSNNHFGGMDGIRGSLFYMEKTGKIVYSTECESFVSLSLSPDAKKSDWFDPNKKVYLKILGLQKLPSRSLSGFFKLYPFGGYTGGVQELTISPNKEWVAGSEDKKIVLYDSQAKFIKTLWTSGKAYGPVFSHDSKYLYFADGFADKPALIKYNLETQESQTFFSSDTIGAISNISPSPDGTQLVFTLITETVPQGSSPEEQWYSEAVEDLYLINSDGTGLTLFLKDARQSAWSPL